MQRISLNHAWKFQLAAAREPDWWWNDPKTDTWQAVDLPHDWSIAGPRRADAPSGMSNGFFEMGRGFYARAIQVPEEWRGKRVWVEFEGVYMNAEVRFDGHFLARHPYGYTTFQVELTPFLKYGQTQELRVRVDNSAQLNSRWYSGSGIYRPAWLVVAEPVHLAQWGVFVTTPRVSRQEAAALIQARVLNDSGRPQAVTVEWQAAAPGGQRLPAAAAQAELQPGEERLFEGELSLPHPALWSPDSPALYQLETRVSAAGQPADQETTPFGVRSLEFSAEKGFLLNGQPLKLKGGCVHHDNGVLGAASFPRSEERKVETLKASGFNAVRCAHNPPAPAFLEACDRLGMLVMDEAFDCWRDGKNSFDYHTAFDDWWQRDIDSMVLRDRNHPAIVLWSIGNEVLERDRPEGAGIAAMLAARLRQLDRTRPVSSALCGTWGDAPWSNTDGVFAALDVGGYNYQWKQYEPDAARLPERIMAGTESFPAEALENWAQVEAHPYVIGDFVWTALDYLGESGIGRVKYEEKEDFLGSYPWHQANCGDLDLCGFKRPQSYYRDILWKPDADLYIAVHAPAPQGKTPSITQWGWPDVWSSWNWPGREGQPFKIDVYSPCEEVELFLNGRSLGRVPTTRAERHTASFEAAYEPGELRAAGYRGGKLALETALQTAGPAAAVRLSADRAAIRAEAGDLCYLTVEIVDAEGRVHPAADRPVYFSIAGPGELIAVGSADPRSEENYRGHARSSYRGRCLAVVKSTGQPGQIRLRALADGLDPSEAVVRARA